MRVSGGFLHLNTIIIAMQKYLRLFLAGLLFPFFANAQTCADASVEITAQVQNSPPKITLNWVSNSGATAHIIYRKLKTGTSWGSPIANLGGTITQYIDSAISAGISYDYKIQRNGTVQAYGYINSGIELPAIEARGKLILLVDSSMATPLAAKITRLQNDLEGDGWSVIRHDISRTAAVTAVKAIIVADYNADPANTKAVFLFGRIPVPYSGNIYPDGHPDHEGAWPADVYYAEVNGNWTDNTINNTVANDPRHDNIPGDGKFDQSQLPSDVDLQIGRVDFANMPAFASSEQQLLENYLDKDHNYRHKVFTATHRAVIDDNFGYFSGEAFAATAWKNFSPLVGTANVSAGDYFTTMTGNSYLWSYGCGGGSYTSAGGIGTTSNFASSSLEGIFSMLFGSYFGDWDATDNFLRAPLAQGTTLTNVWGGRPHWVFTHMAMGEPIGYDARVSQNNIGLYFASYGGRLIHNALMGDPTLRNDVVAPVDAVVATASGTNCNIAWTSSPDATAGYYIYMKNDTMTEYVRINNTPVMGNLYTDTCLLYPGVYTYMVRGLKMENSPSGTYYNLSQGISDTAWNSNYLVVNAAATYSAAGNVITFTNSSSNATTYAWDFGDNSTDTQQNPTHPYLDGSYTVTLIAGNGCDADTITIPVVIATGINDITADAAQLQVFPNPSNGMFTLSLENRMLYPATLKVYNSTGACVYNLPVQSDKTAVDLSQLPSGMYSLLLRTESGALLHRRIVLNR